MDRAKVAFLVILLVASLLRLWRLDEVPLNLFGDEVDVGYHAYSLLQTGKDYMGQLLPVYIHSLAEWRAPLFIYSTIPSIAVFGLNEWGVRLPAAIFGIIGVLLLYLLGRRLFNQKVGLISALLLAMLPWHIHYSRAAFEVTLLLVLLLAATLLFLTGGKRNIVLSSILFALTPYTYSTAVVFTPLYVLLLIFLKRRELPRQELSHFLVTAFVLILPFIYVTAFGPAAGRFSLISVFGDDRLIDTINIERTETGLTYERLFHNKLIGWGEVIVANYVQAFSPEFLFANGDPNPRHSVPGTGVLYWAFLPMLLMGIYKLAKVKLPNLLLLGWLLLAPIPASLTVDGANHATRLFLLIPPLVLISGYGAYWLMQQKGKYWKISSAVIGAFLLLNLIGYYHRYFNHYNLQFWRYWHHGYKDAMQEIGQKQDDYQLAFINNTYEPSLLHYLFWTKYSPEKFQREFNSDIPKEDLLTGFNGFQLSEKIYFGQAENLLEFLKPNMLYLAVQGKEIPGDWDWGKEPPAGVKVLHVVRTPAGEPLFTLVSKE